MSAGTGASGGLGSDQPVGFTGLSQNYIGAILEVIANYSSQGFALAAGLNQVPVTTDVTNPGVHDWPYWSVQCKKSWPQLAQAIGADFTVQGAIADKWNQLRGAQGVLGYPTSNELDVTGGKVSHFQYGDIYWSQGTGAWEMQGAILAKYNQLGANSGSLGLPVTDETNTPTKPGKFNHFANGYIYWTPTTGAHNVQGPILDYWALPGPGLGYENSRFGFPTSDQLNIAGVLRSTLQVGSIEYIAGAIVAS